MARLKKHPGRKRRIAGWFVLAWAVVFAGLWVASRWWDIGVQVRRTTLGFAGGMYGIVVESGPTQTPVQFQPVFISSLTGWEWWHWEWQNPSVGNGGEFAVIISGWVVPGVLTIIGVPLLRSGMIARRARVGLCRKCGYNLAGLPPGSPCPECGTKA